MVRIPILIALLGLALPAQTPQEGPPPGPLPRRAYELNQQGVGLHEKGDHDGAVSRFEEARALDPGNEVLGTNLARALQGRARDRMEKGRHADALHDLHRARDLRPKDADVGILLARAYGEAGDAWRQRQVLQRLLEEHPADARGFESLGRLEYAEENLEKARELLETAARLDPERAKTAAFSGFLEKVRREAKVEGRYFLEERGIFRVKYDDETFREIGQQVLDILDRHTTRLSSELQVQPRGRIIVVLYTRKDYDLATGAHGWTGGLFDGTKIRLPVRNFRTAATQIDSTLAHELSHLFVRQITRRSPLWLDEGLAQLSEGRRPDAVATVLRAARQEKKLQSIGSLPENWSRIGDAVRVRRYYAQALSFSDFLVRRYGQLTVTRFLQDLGRGAEPWAKVFEATFQRDLDSVEADWLLDV